MSELVCLSVAHDTAPVAWRERLAVRARAQGAAAAGHVRAGVAGEALVLATCRCVDTYVVATDGDRAELALLERLAGARAWRTASWSRARERCAAPRPRATCCVRVGRRVRAETPLGAGAISLSSVGTRLARTLFGDAPGRRALVVGATRSARGVVVRLVADGWAVTSLLDRSDGPALAPLLDAFDLVVTCTGRRSRLLPVEALVDAAAGRDERPLLVLDLSVPRDVDPAAGELEGVLLYDVDDLAAAAEHAIAARRAGVPERSWASSKRGARRACSSRGSRPCANASGARCPTDWATR